MRTSTEAHGFELKNRRKAPWIIAAVVLLIALAVVVRIAFFGGTASANETEGANLVVATAEGNASEQALVEFVADQVAPQVRHHGCIPRTRRQQHHQTAPSAKVR